MNPFRHQLPVYSPISLRGILSGTKALLPAGNDPRERLREQLEARYQGERAVLVGSGTQALQLAIELALAERGGGERIVALPAFSCYDIASAAVGADARIALYDLDPSTLSPDLATLERAFRAGARVAVVAHLYGIPAHWEDVTGLADRYGAVVIEDAAQGFGGSWRGRPLGSLGRLSVLSFGRGKGWTGGSGGALLLRGGAGFSDHLPEPGRGGAMKPMVRSAAQWGLGRPAWFGIPMAVPGLGLGETVYHAPSEPQRLPAAAAVLVLEGHDASAAESEVRRRSARALRAALTEIPGVAPVAVAAEADPGYLRFPVWLPGGLESLSDPARARRLGIAASYPTPLDALPQVQARLAPSSPACPGAEQLPRQMITLPCHSRVTGEDRREIIELLRRQ